MRLQFGHGGDAVGDSVSGAGSGRQTWSFNSATAVTPWVTESPGVKAAAKVESFNSATAVTPWVTA